MSSYIEPSFSDATSFEQLPLHPGHYYLVDITPVLETYFKASPKARYENIAEGAPLTEYDVADVELTELIPCISALSDKDEELDKHISELLNEGVQRLAQDFYGPEADEHIRSLANTPEQNQHASAVYELGQGLRQLLKQHGMYDEHGELIAEYDSLLDNGIMAMREWAR